MLRRSQIFKVGYLEQMGFIAKNIERVVGE